MKAKFSINTSLRAGEDGGLQNVRTPLLMLTKFSGMGLGDEMKRVDAAYEGRICSAITRKGFKGNRGEHLSLNLGEDSDIGRILFVGLGKSGNFGCETVRDLVRLTINRAVALKQTRVTVPILPNRLTQTNLNLRGTAHIIRSVAEDVLSAKKGDGELEIELLCTPQAKRHVEAGLNCQPRRSCKVCDEQEQAAS